MNNEPNFTEALHYLLTLGPDEVVKRLKGVQGPEQGLVEESRSARQQGAAEEVKPGERDVAEIVGADELRRHIARIMDESRLAMEKARKNGSEFDYDYNLGKSAGMIELCELIGATAEKRSDLSNAGGMAATPEQP